MTQPYTLTERLALIWKSAITIGGLRLPAAMQVYPKARAFTRKYLAGLFGFVIGGQRGATGKATGRPKPLALMALLILALRPAAAGADDHPEIVEFWLVDADTDVRIERLEDYASLRLPMLPYHLSIEAVAAGDTESVALEINHAPSSTENFEPYALGGDNAGDFNPVPEIRVPGWITISATPYAGPDLSGLAGAETHLHLYLHQPDFVVRHPADIGDYDPGDGWCTTGPPLVLTDKLIVAAEELSEWELALRETDARRSLQPDAAATDELVFAQKRTADMVAERKALTPISALQSRLKSGDGDGDTGRSGTAVDDLAAWEEHHRWAEFDLDDLVLEWFPQRGCTLRAAIEESNALAGKQSVLIDAAKGPFILTEGQIDITDAIDLIGHDALAVVEASAGARIFYISGDHIMNLRSLELAGGSPGTSERGGAIWIDNDALVQMSDSVVRDSQANYGGGIYLQNGGDLTLTRSAIRDNIAGTPEDGIDGGGVTQRGGGIYNLKGNVTIRDSSISDNLAVRGGGLSNAGGTLRVENSSVIDNEALAIGGGIENHHAGEDKGKLYLSFATVAHNQAGTSMAPPDNHRVGGGLYNTGWTDMASSILAHNTDGWSAGDPLHAPDCHSPDPHDFTSYRHNLVGVLNGNCDFGDYIWGNTAWIDHGTEGSPLDAELGTPMFWGNIRYRMIFSSSPAVDAAASPTATLYACPDHDSRGRPRPAGSGCDIGAVERQ